MQVHNAAAAHINTHTQAILPLATVTSNSNTANQSFSAQQGMQNSNAATATLGESTTRPADMLTRPADMLVIQSDQPGDPYGILVALGADDEQEPDFYTSSSTRH
jgi:hypothetical protein